MQYPIIQDAMFTTYVLYVILPCVIGLDLFLLQICQLLKSAVGEDASINLLEPAPVLECLALELFIIVKLLLWVGMSIL